MKKLVLLATALAMVSGSALAADMRVKAVKAPPPVAFDPWDIAFGSAIMNDYVFRGITQSNHKPSVAAYFEPRYNVTKDLQLYVGLAGASISFPNRAAAEIDIYGGIRPTFGMFAFDFGLWGYLYPGGQCFNAVHSRLGHSRLGERRACAPECRGQRRSAGQRQLRQEERQLLRRLRQGQRDPQRHVRGRRQRVLLAELPELGAWGNYASITGKFTAPSSTFGTSGVGMYISGEFGRQWLGTSDSFYGTARSSAQPFPNGIQEPSYNTWNIGIGFTYKVFTLDLRYSDTNLSKGDCNAFTSDFTPRSSASSDHAHHGDQSGRRSAPTGAARPASSSSRLT